MQTEARPLSAFERTKLCDLLFAAPVIGWFIYCIARMYPFFARAIWELMLGTADLELIAAFIAQIAVFLLAALFIGFLIVRPPPIAKTRGVWPRVVAVVGSFSVVAIWSLPYVNLSPALNIVSALLIFLGSGFALYAALHLGKSFSILPEARRLATSGPFGLIRHPVYLGEEVALIGVMLQFRQPWSLILLATQLGFQLLRMSYEERLLATSFPEYDAYRARTARLVPGVY
jgi:protein-S-isoprenylcysteine O-methyltransferase Ste14